MKPKAPKPRRIRNFNDLSFNKRDADGKHLAWFMPARTNNWHEHYGIGETWFEEIVQLARVKPEHAYRAMKYGAAEACTKYGSYGHTEGFFDMMARWALAGILASEKLPELPFKINEMGLPTREGMEYWLSREGKKVGEVPDTQSPYKICDNKNAIGRGIRLVAVNGQTMSTPTS